MNIDVEGNDFKVISSFNFLKYKPKMISIEQNIHNLDEIMISECHNLLSSKGYFLTAKIGVTCIYLEKRSEKNIEEILSI